MPAFNERIPADTKSTRIHEILKQDICDGRLKVGARLVISKVAEAYGISEIPVREALSRLQAEGLVTIIPHTGIYVTEMDTERLGNLYPIRGVLEGYATRLALPNLTPTDFGRLSQLIETMDNVIEREDYPEMGRLNREFHMTIYRACKNEPLVDMIDELWGKTTRVRGIFGLMPEIATRSNRQHKEILEALKGRNKRRAETLIIQQNQNTLKSLILYLGQRKEARKPVE